MFIVLAQRQAQLHSCGVLPHFGAKIRYEQTCTVAMLAQGTLWAVAADAGLLWGAQFPELAH